MVGHNPVAVASSLDLSSSAAGKKHNKNERRYSVNQYRYICFCGLHIYKYKLYIKDKINIITWAP